MGFINTPNFTLKKPDQLQTPYTTEVNANFDIIDIEMQANQDAAAANAIAIGDAWVSVSATLAHSSDDVETFIATTSSDLTGIISVGQRLRLEGSVVGAGQHFIVVAITAGNMTLYGGPAGVNGSFTVADTITNVFFSAAKAPFGFPAGKDSWTERITFAVNETGGLTLNTLNWENPTGHSLAFPRGEWEAYYHIIFQFTLGAGEVAQNMSATLSTTNNSESDLNHTSKYQDSASTNNQFPFTKRFPVTLASKTTHFLNLQTTTNTNNTTKAARGDNGETIIEIVSAYI